MILDKPSVLVDIGVAIGPHEEHVLQEVREPLTVGWIVKLPDPNVNCCRCHVDLGVGHDNRAEAIAQLDQPVVTVVQGALAQGNLGAARPLTRACETGQRPP